MSKKHKIESLARRSALRLMVALVCAVFVAEGATLVALEQFSFGSPLLGSVVDAVVLTAALFPVLYLFVFRRVFRQNMKLARSQARLEDEVEARTREFRTLNGKFNTALSNMSQGLCMFDSDKRLIVCNERYASMYGLSSEQVKPGTTASQILECRIANSIYAGENPDEYKEQVLDWINRRVDGKKIKTLNDGRIIEMTRHPMDGGGWVSTHEDVTEIAQAQSAVQRKSEELALILKHVRSAVMTADSAGIITSFNPAAEETFGYAADEVIGQNVSILMPEKMARNHGHYINAYLTTGTSTFIEAGPRDLLARHKDGHEFSIELSLSRFGAGTNMGFIGVAKDITAQLEEKNDLIGHRDLLQDKVDLATAELKSKAEELARALAKEKEINEQQRQFISTTSHEFRTPLAVIDGSVQRMLRRKEKLTPEDVEKKGKKIRAAVRTMTSLMESTLSAARMEAGMLEIKVEKCDLRASVLEACVHQLELNEDNRIVCDLAALPDAVIAESNKLDQIFTNLISNAVKYSPEGPDITVRGWCEGDYAVISFADRGVGIEEDDLPKLFGRFFRARTSLGIPGTGIGLAVVKKLVELHGGTISVESAKGKGSVFTVRLPVSGPRIEAGCSEQDAA